MAVKLWGGCTRNRGLFDGSAFVFRACAVVLLAGRNAGPDGDDSHADGHARPESMKSTGG